MVSAGGKALPSPLESVDGDDNTSYLPGKQGGLKGNEAGKQHRALGASGPEPTDDAFFTFFSGKIKANS